MLVERLKDVQSLKNFEDDAELHFMKKADFQNIKADPCLFHCKKSQKYLYVANGISHH